MATPESVGRTQVPPRATLLAGVGVGVGENNSYGRSESGLSSRRLSSGSPVGLPSAERLAPVDGVAPRPWNRYRFGGAALAVLGGRTKAERSEPFRAIRGHFG